MTSILDLPQTILIEIFSNLKLAFLLKNVHKVCRTWRNTRNLMWFTIDSFGFEVLGNSKNLSIDINVGLLNGKKLWMTFSPKNLASIDTIFNYFVEICPIRTRYLSLSNCWERLQSESISNIGKFKNVRRLKLLFYEVDEYLTDLMVNMFANLKDLEIVEFQYYNYEYLGKEFRDQQMSSIIASACSRCTKLRTVKMECDIFDIELRRSLEGVLYLKECQWREDDVSGDYFKEILAILSRCSNSLRSIDLNCVLNFDAQLDGAACGNVLKEIAKKQIHQLRIVVRRRIDPFEGDEEKLIQKSEFETFQHDTFSALIYFNHLKELTLEGLNFSAKSSIPTVLQRLSFHLTKLTFRLNRSFNDEFFHRLLDFGSMTSLESLVIDNCFRFDRPSEFCLAEFVSKCSKLKKLHLFYMPDFCVHDFCKYLHRRIHQCCCSSTAIPKTEFLNIWIKPVDFEILEIDKFDPKKLCSLKSIAAKSATGFCIFKRCL